MEAFPEKQTSRAFDPHYAASFMDSLGAFIKNPEELIQTWHRLPDDLHQQDCGTDTLGALTRCLDETFKGSGQQSVGTSVTAHFDTIGGSWHFVGFTFDGK